MKWFKLQTDVLTEPAIAAVCHRFGDEGLGRLLKLWIIAARTGRLDKIGAVVDAQGHPCALGDVAIAIGVPEAPLEDLLAFLADRQHIDPRAWKRRAIIFPHLATAFDEYTEKAQRKRRGVGVSGPSPDSIPTVSGKKRSDQKRSDQKRSRPPSAVGHARERAGRPAGGDRPSAGAPQPGAPKKTAHFIQLAAIAGDLRRRGRFGLSEADLKEDLKRELAQRGLEAESLDAIRKALDASAHAVRRHA